MTKKVFAVVGGDLRQVELASSLAKDGHTVRIFGFSSDIEVDSSVCSCETAKLAIDGSEIVIFPLPISKDDVHINAPLFDSTIKLSDLLGFISKEQLVFGGLISKIIYSAFEQKSIKLFDYFEREELTVLNAIPTAEGAIQIAMEELPITLHNSNVLILGFGRIGKVLAKMLHGIGANVSVNARKHSDLAWIECYGYTPIKQARWVGKKYDLIVNTIPKIMIDAQALSKVDKKCLVIDLASKPGGVDFNAAKELGVKVIWALSLPGKVAPYTSGLIIKHTVINILNEILTQNISGNNAN